MSVFLAPPVDRLWVSDGRADTVDCEHEQYLGLVLVKCKKAAPPRAQLAGAIIGRNDSHVLPKLDRRSRTLGRSVRHN
jgi:hypothetical protein